MQTEDLHKLSMRVLDDAEDNHVDLKKVRELHRAIDALYRGEFAAALEAAALKARVEKETAPRSLERSENS